MFSSYFLVCLSSFVMSKNYCCLKSTFLSITCAMHISIYRRVLLHNYLVAFNLIYIYFFMYLSPLYAHTHTRARVIFFFFYSNSQGKSVAEENFHQSAIVQQQHQQRKMTKCFTFVLFQCLFTRSMINDLILFTFMHNFSKNFKLFLLFVVGRKIFTFSAFPLFIMRFLSFLYALWLESLRNLSEMELLNTFENFLGVFGSILLEFCKFSLNTSPFPDFMSHKLSERKEIIWKVDKGSWNRAAHALSNKIGVL